MCATVDEVDDKLMIYASFSGQNVLPKQEDSFADSSGKDSSKAKAQSREWLLDDDYALKKKIILQMNYRMTRGMPPTLVSLKIWNNTLIPPQYHSCFINVVDWFARGRVRIRSNASITEDGQKPSVLRRWSTISRRITFTKGI